MFAQRRPLVCGFLYAVLAEIALTCLQQRLDLIRAAALGDRNQGHAIRFTTRDLASLGNAAADFSQSGGGIERQNLKAVPT